MQRDQLSDIGGPPMTRQTPLFPTMHSVARMWRVHDMTPAHLIPL
jgi:hypothetical protein